LKHVDGVNISGKHVDKTYIYQHIEKICW